MTGAAILVVIMTLSGDRPPMTSAVQQPSMEVCRERLGALKADGSYLVLHADCTELLKSEDSE